MSTKIVIPSVLIFICSSVTFFFQIYKQTKKHGFEIGELLRLSQDAEPLNCGI